MEDMIDQYIIDNKLELFPLDDRSYIHNIISLIISQRIRFTQSRKIRSKIYQILGCNKLDGILQLSEQQRELCGLSAGKWETICNFMSMTSETKIPGIGQWTINCQKIMCGDYSCGFLTNDSSVNALVRKILGPISDRELRILYKDDPERGGRAFSALWNSVRNISS